MRLTLKNKVMFRNIRKNLYHHQNQSEYLLFFVFAIWFKFWSCLIICVMRFGLERDDGKMIILCVIEFSERKYLSGKRSYHWKTYFRLLELEFVYIYLWYNISQSMRLYTPALRCSLPPYYLKKRMNAETSLNALFMRFEAFWNY